jgi:hypothetical protein
MYQAFGPAGGLTALIVIRPLRAFPRMPSTAPFLARRVVVFFAFLALRVFLRELPLDLTVRLVALLDFLAALLDFDCFATLSSRLCIVIVHNQEQKSRF